VFRTRLVEEFAKLHSMAEELKLVVEFGMDFKTSIRVFLRLGFSQYYFAGRYSVG
jgi:hypothetical protein